MYGRHSRCLYAVWSNPAPDVTLERFREYYEDVHRPDTLAVGHFDRSYRYEAVGPCRARYLTLWEAEYPDQRTAIDQVKKGALLLQQQGRIWPVQEVVFHQFGFAPPHPVPERPVATLTTVQNDWRTPARDLDAETWSREALPSAMVLSSSYAALFLYASGSRFLWLGESEASVHALTAVWRDRQTDLPPLGAPTPIFPLPRGAKKPPRDPGPSKDAALRSAAWVVHWKPTG